MANEIQKLIDDLTSKVEKIKPELNDIQELYALLEGIKKRTGASFKLPDVTWLPSKKDREHGKTIDVQKNQGIAPGTFFGKTPAEAAEEYLKMVGRAVPFDEIYTALTSGSVAIENREKFNLSLTRGVRKFRKFKTDSGDHFGLLSQYPKREKRGKINLSLQHPIFTSETPIPNNTTEEQNALHKEEKDKKRGGI